MATGLKHGPDLQHSAELREIAFSDDSRLVATASRDATARIWDSATGQAITPPLVHLGSVECLEFSPGGDRLLTGSFDHSARQWDARSGLPIGRTMTHGDAVWAVRYVPDGKRIVTASFESFARLWSAGPQTENAQRIKPGAGAVQFEFSPRGDKLLVAVKHGHAQIWDLATAKQIGPMLVLPDEIGAAAFSADGAALALASEGGSVAIWDANTGKELAPPLHYDGGPLTCLAFSPDGALLASGSAAGSVHLQNIRQHQTVLGHEFAVGSAKLDLLCFAADSKSLRVVLSNGKVFTIPATDLESRWPLAPPMLPRIAAVPTLRSARFFHFVSSPQEVPPPPATPKAEHGTRARSMSTGSADVQAEAGQAMGDAVQTPQPQAQPSPSVNFHGLLPAAPRATLSADTKLAANELDGTIVELRTVGHPERAFKLTHPDLVNCIAFSPDGKLLLTASGYAPENRGQVRLWDTATGEPRGLPLEDASLALAATFSSDGRFIATGSSQGIVRIWDTATGRAIGPRLFFGESVRHVGFSSSGHWIAAAGDSGTVMIWPVPQAASDSAAQLMQRIEAATGLSLDEGGGVRVLNPGDWEQIAPARGDAE